MSNKNKPANNFAPCNNSAIVDPFKQIICSWSEVYKKCNELAELGYTVKYILAYLMVGGSVSQYLLIGEKE